MAQAASCREGAKRPADGNKPPMTYCQNVKTALARTAQTGAGGNRTEMREPRAPKGMQDESRKPVSATFCRPPRNAVRPDPAPRVSPARGMACKRTNGICTWADSIQSGKSPPKPCFSLLYAPARRFVSLRKAILFFPRKNDCRDGEMLHTNSFSVRVLTVRPLFAAFRPVIETRKRKENLSFWQEIPYFGDNPT